MGLNIKNAEVEQLAAKVAALTGETKTEAIRRALEERAQRLGVGQKGKRAGRLEQWLRTSVWPQIPKSARKPISKEEEEAILGFGPHGV